MKVNNKKTKELSLLDFFAWFLCCSIAVPFGVLPKTGKLVMHTVKNF